MRGNGIWQFAIRDSLERELASSIAAAEQTSPSSRIEPVLYGAMILLGAFLLFQVEFILGKYILPWFGGSTGVWATCLLFFQTFLLAGYAYAHLISTRLSRSQQAKLHSVVLGISLALLCVMASRWPSPITPGAAWQPADARHPVGMILLILAASIGIPFLLLSTTASLLQRWFTYTHPGKSPYRFYALSNLGSLLGLLTYPFVIERLLRLHTQAWMWSVMFAAYAAGMVLCARQMAASPLAAIPDIHES